MKVLSSLIPIVPLMTSFFSHTAYAQFKCGPGFYTYSVSSLAGAVGQGVRCVKFSNYQVVDGLIAGANWYGEGYWGSTKYRHIGVSFKTLKNLNGAYTAKVYATDVYGNGENSAGKYQNLSLQSVNGYSKIRVNGWNEEWTLQTTGIHANYTTVLGPVNNCGNHLEKYTVSDINGVAAPGVRCAMRDPYIALPSVWLGYGSWGTTGYAHFGFVTGNQSDYSVGLGTASDLCNQSNFYCGSTQQNGLNIKALMGCFQSVKFKITGNWNEYWTGTNTLQCVTE